MARGSRSSISAASPWTSAVCCSSSSSSWSRMISVTTACSFVATIWLGWTNPSRPSVVSGESSSRGKAATKSAASLTAFTSLPFAVPGCSLRPSIDDLQLACRERLDLELADPRAVERVGGLCPERLDVEVVGATSHLLVDREADPKRRPRLVRAVEVRDGGHDLRDARLVVGAEQRRAVARDDVVPDPRRERRLIGRIQHLARVPRQHDRRARVVLVHDRRHSGSGRLRRRVDVRDQADHGRSRRAGHGRVDVAELGQLDIGEPDLPQLRLEDAREIELLGGARKRRRSLLRLGVDADVAEKALEHAVGELGGERRGVRDASQGRRGGGTARRPSRSRAAGTRPGCARWVSGCSTR